MRIGLSLFEANIFPDRDGREFGGKPLSSQVKNALRPLSGATVTGIPCKIPCLQGMGAETGALSNGAPARQLVLSPQGGRQVENPAEAGRFPTRLGL